MKDGFYRISYGKQRDRGLGKKDPEKNIDLLDEDSAPMKMGSRRGRTYFGPWEMEDRHKSFSCKPTRRFLLKNVGRSWDDIWSEICRSNRGSSRPVYRFKDSFSWFVSFDLAEVDGKLLDPKGKEENPRRGYSLYVLKDDPKRILRIKYPPEGGMPRKIFQNLNFRIIDGRYYGRNSAGAWFELTMKETRRKSPWGRFNEDFFDRLLKKYFDFGTFNQPPKMFGSDRSTGSYREFCEFYGSSSLYCSKLTPLNSKRIKELGLNG